MKLTASKTQLNEALSATLAVAPSRSTLPVLENTLLSAIDGRLTLKATDLDLHMATGFPCELAREGAICLPSKRLASLIRELPTETVSFEVSGQVATISSGKLVTRLNGLPAEEFPSGEDEDFSDSITLPGTELSAAIRRTAFCASTDETRYILNGLLLQGGETPIVIGTDGRRLSRVQIEAAIPESVCAILPNKAIAAIQKIITDSPVTLEIGESFAAVHGENAILRTRLIAGTYPDWKQVMPKHLPHSLEIDRETLLSAVRRVGLLANDKVSSITLTFTPESLTVSASSPTIGEATELIEMLCKIEGEVTLNTHYLQQALQAVPDEAIQWNMQDAEYPVLLRAGAWEHVLMPMRKA